MAKSKSSEKRRAKKKKERARRIQRVTNVRRNNAGDSPIEELPGEEVTAPWTSSFATERALRGARGGLDDPRVAAQELAYRSMEATSRSTAERFAREAVALDSECVDALAVLALARRKPDERIAGLERVLDAAERALGGAGYFTENAGRFWGILETRPYMRTRRSLADDLVSAGRSGEAAAHYRAMLDLNPNDNQGIRYPLLGLLLEEGDVAAARALLAEYPDEGTALFAWGKALERFLAGDRAGAARALHRARRENEFVVPGLLGKRLRGRRDGSYIRGDESEGAFIVEVLGPAFDEHDAALEWLADGGPVTTHDERIAALDSYGPPVDELLGLGEVTFGTEWQESAPTNLGPDDVGELIRMATEPALSELPSDTREVWAPIHALRALGQLRAGDAAEPLAAVVAEDLEDEILENDLPTVLAMIGPPSVPPLTRILRDEKASSEARSTAAESLAELARRHPDVEADCLDPIAEQLRHYSDNCREFNANLIWELVTVRGERHLDLVKEVFDAGRVHEGTCGDWPEVRDEARRSSGGGE